MLVEAKTELLERLNGEEEIKRGSGFNEYAPKRDCTMYGITMPAAKA